MQDTKKSTTTNIIYSCSTLATARRAGDEPRLYYADHADETRKNMKRHCMGCHVPLSNTSTLTYSQKSGNHFPRQKCQACEQYCCPVCIKIGDTICYDCYILSVSSSTRPPVRDERVRLLCFYEARRVCFFEDANGVPYKLSLDDPNWTALENELFRQKPNRSQLVSFVSKTKNVSLNWKTLQRDPCGYRFEHSKKKHRITVFETPSMNNSIKLVKVHNCFDPTEIYQGVIQRANEWFDILDSCSGKQKKEACNIYLRANPSDKFDAQQFRYPSVHLSSKRFGLNYLRTWKVAKGKKYDTARAQFNYTNDPRGLTPFNVRQHETLTENLLSVAVKYGLLREKYHRTFYKATCSGYKHGRFGGLCTNFIGYPFVGRMAPHVDISNKALNDGFDLKLLMVGTLTAEPIKGTKQKFGTKLLSFGMSAMMEKYEGMAICTEPGDVLLMSPPATTKWKHGVPPVRCRRCITMQWRRWLGAGPIPVR